MSACSTCHGGGRIWDSTDHEPWAMHIISDVDAEDYWEAWMRKGRGQDLGALMDPLDYERSLYQCPECGRLEEGPDLSMYVRNPDVPRREKGIWSVAAPLADADYVSPMELKEEQTYTLYAPGHICEKCGKPMKSITDNELMRSRFDKEKETDRTEVSCPECGDLLWIAEICMWD